MVSIDLDSLLVEVPIAISPCFEGKHYSIIHSDHGNFYSVSKVENLVDNYCLNYGSDLRGRMKATRKKLGIRKLPPILLSPEKVGLQFPSPCRKGVIWIFDMNFVVKSKGRRESVIIINEDLQFHVRMSKRAVRNKVAQAMEVLLIFTQGHGKRD